MKNAMKKVALFVTAIILFGCASDDEPEEVISGASPTTTTEVNENGLPIVKEPTSITETMLHTVVQMQVYHEGVEDVMQEAIDYMAEMETLLSTNVEGSDVYRINENAGIEPVEVQPETMENIKSEVMMRVFQKILK